ncbi:hypothetical protein D3C75_1205420 [compost metagenome]
MPQKMSSELAGRSFPAPVQLGSFRIVDHLKPGQNNSRLQIEVLQQAPCIQLHQIVPVHTHSFPEHPWQQLYISFIDCC